MISSPSALLNARFRARHYNEAVRGLNIAFNVFEETSDDPERAAEAFKDFVLNHYLKIWRSTECQEPT